MPGYLAQCAASCARRRKFLAWTDELAVCRSRSRGPPYALRRVDPATADDVVSDVLVVAFRRLEVIPGPPLPWLLATARKVIATQRRATNRRVAAWPARATACRSSADALTQPRPDGGWMLRAAFPNTQNCPRCRIQWNTHPFSVETSSRIPCRQSSKLTIASVAAPTFGRRSHRRHSPVSDRCRAHRLWDQRIRDEVIDSVTTSAMSRVRSRSAALPRSVQWGDTDRR